MVISTNLISAPGGRKLSEFFTSNMYRYRSDMNNQTRYAKSAQYNLEGLVRAFWELCTDKIKNIIHDSLWE